MICYGIISCNGFLDLGLLVAAGFLIAAFALKDYGSKKLGWVFVGIAVLAVFVSLLAEMEQGPRYDHEPIRTQCKPGYVCVDALSAVLDGYENCIRALCDGPDSPSMVCCPAAEPDSS